MNSATRGIILAIAAVILGVLILGQGFDEPDTSVSAASPTPTPTPDSTISGADGGADDGGTSADAGTADVTDGQDDGTTSDDGGVNADGGDTPTDGEPADGAAAPTTAPKPPNEVRVLVANDTATGGLAGAIRDQLASSQGYNGLTPTDSTTQGSGAPSKVYFAPGYETDARTIAQILGLDAGAVGPLPADPPVADLNNANVLVVIGPDLIPPG